MAQAIVLKEAELKRALAVVAGRRHADRDRLALLLTHWAGMRVTALCECHKDFVAWQSTEDAKLDKVIDKAIADFHKKEQVAERRKAKALKEKERTRKEKAKAKNAKK